ncbi:MAG: hypothetical protein P8X74_13445 [Reinekea sp.]
MDRANSNLDNIDHYDYSQTPQEDGQHSSQPEIGQTFGGVASSGPSWNQAVLGQPQPHQDFNFPHWVPPSLGSDWEYLLRTPQPAPSENIIQNDAPPELSSPQPVVGRRRKAPAKGLPPTKERFLEGLNKYARGELLKDCSATIKFRRYVTNDGHLRLPGQRLYDELKPEEQARVDQALRSRQSGDKDTVTKRFLDGLEAYARGELMKDCSATIKYTDFVSADGHLHEKGQRLRNKLGPEDKARVDQALISRQSIGLADNDITMEHFWEGLDAYARGELMKDCSATLKFRRYATGDGHLRPPGQRLYDGLKPEDKAWVDQALISRRSIRLADNGTTMERFWEGLEPYQRGELLKNCSETLEFRSYVAATGRLRREGQRLYDDLGPEEQARVNRVLISRQNINLERLATNDTPLERFMEGLEVYRRGESLKKCSGTLEFTKYVTDDGRLGPRGHPLYKKLGPEDKERVKGALAARRRRAVEHLSGDIPHFLAVLVPYGNGLDLQECGKQSGLKKKRYQKVERYFTPEGGLTAKGELLIENLQPNQQRDVWLEIGKRRQLINPSAQEPGSPWQLPEMPSSMPEMEWMNQAVPGTWGIPSESAESSIPHYGSDVVGMDFQHRYDSNGLMPQRAPDRLIGRGIVHGTLINIQGEVYRVHDTGQRSVNPTNENPLGNIFMLVPRMRGG